MLRSLSEFLLLVAIIAAIGGRWLYSDYQHALNDPLQTGEKAVTYLVEPGATFRTVAKDLHMKGWWPHSSRYLLWTVQKRGIGGKLKSGEYELTPGITIEQLLELLISGKTVQHQFTIVEGWTFAQVRAAVAASEIIKQTLAPELSDAGVMVKLGYAGEHPEGRFYPDTYNVMRNTTDVEVLQRAHERLREVLDKAWEARASDLPYKDPASALTMASIIEKETGVPDERPVIASVFVQRLKRGMKLQTDPTVIYGLGEKYDGNIRKNDLETDTPYNTYTREGLPPTPIAMVGKEAIEAALHPAASEAIYFVAKGDGSHYFSKTLEEHNQAVAKFQLGQGNNQPQTGTGKSGR